MDKILAEASVNETKNDDTDCDLPNLEEPMEEGVNSGDSIPQDPEIEMVPSLNDEQSAQQS